MVRLIEHEFKLKCRDVIHVDNLLVIKEHKVRGKTNPVNDFVGVVEIAVFGTCAKLLTVRHGAFIAIDKVTNEIKCYGKIYGHDHGLAMLANGDAECMMRVARALGIDVIITRNAYQAKKLECGEVEVRTTKASTFYLCYISP